MSSYVYIIGAIDKSGARTYVGWTTDLDARLDTHNSGKGAKSTRGRVWTLLYAERYQSRSKAMSREWHLKRDRGFRNHIKVALYTEVKIVEAGS
ncbi:MAG: GIY-YIG nuclease family protein [Rhodospirillales bacterium]